MFADLTPSKMGHMVMQVWPDDTDTSAVKGRRHALAGGKWGRWSAGDGGSAMMTNVVLLSWAFQMLSGRRGRLAIPDVKWCERRQACRKPWDG